MNEWNDKEKSRLSYAKNSDTVAEWAIIFSCLAFVAIAKINEMKRATANSQTRTCIRTLFCRILTNEQNKKLTVFSSYCLFVSPSFVSLPLAFDLCLHLLLMLLAAVCCFCCRFNFISHFIRMNCVASNHNGTRSLNAKNNWRTRQWRRLLRQ